ncbi:MAG: 6-carboxytetrahydropterin synthase [Cyanobacteria bacterium P01_A01_bin.105]
MPKWKLTTEFTFDAAHYIRDYDGPCGRMHDHTYAEMIAQYIYDKTTSDLPDTVKLTVAVSETPSSWAEYEDD